MADYTLSLDKKDKRLSSIMIEINRRLCLDDAFQVIDPEFTTLQSCIDNLYGLITAEAKVSLP
ncbi:MAG: hypothetical protein ACI8UP_003217 [Porticoccaceae bacterium]|jgi:hypothetical protein